MAEERQQHFRVNVSTTGQLLPGHLYAPIGNSSFAENIMSAATDGFFEWHTHEDRYFFSDSFAKLLQYPPNILPIEYGYISAHVCAEDFMDLRLKMAQAAYRSEEIITNFRMHVADGSLRWFELRLSIIKQNARGQATVLLGCVRDINEYITQEMDMQQRMEKERWVQEQIGNILNDDSEQSFNNCLNALCAYIDTDYITLRCVGRTNKPNHSNSLRMAAAKH